MNTRGRSTPTNRRDSWSAHEISLGNIWMDDVDGEDSGRRASLTRGRMSSTLEDSLQLFQNELGSVAEDDVGVRFDEEEDHEVHSLFPMLSESSFDYDNDDVLPSDRESNVADENAFPDDLSPILAAMPPPKDMLLTSRSSLKLVNTMEPRRKQNASMEHRPSLSLESEKKNLVTKSPKAPFKATSSRVPSPAEHALTPSELLPTRKRRRLRSTGLSTIHQWDEHEQNVFFSIFKTKWTPTTGSISLEDTALASEFESLLMQRFKTISEKLKSGKSSSDVQLFYISVLQLITDLLDDADPHDIDLSNPDEIRIALWCWHKLSTDDLHKNEFLAIESANLDTKRRLANVLLQSIIRSRRQMMKAKCSSYAYPSGQAQSNRPVLPALPSEQPEVNLEGLLREALANAAFPLQMPLPELKAGTPIHHPQVRKKRKLNIDTMGANHNNQVTMTPTPGSKRQRSLSTEKSASLVNHTPIKPLQADLGADSFMTPQPVGKSSTAVSVGPDLYTPPQSTRKKIYIMFRMVPRDAHTRDILEKCRYNPKVELKLSSSKRVTDVVDHMMKKWSKVRPHLPNDVSLHFFPKESSGSPKATMSWSQSTSDVTCLDIWKQCGKVKNDEYVVLVSYQWCKLSVDDVDSIKGGSASNSRLSLSWMDHDAAPLLDIFDGDASKKLDFEQDLNEKTPSPPPSARLSTSLDAKFAEEVEKLMAGSDDSPFGGNNQHTGPTQSLQAFSETVAFKSDDALNPAHDLDELDDPTANILIESDHRGDYSPDSGRLRRRITPMLVQTDECHI